METGMAQQPARDQRGFMGAGVVQNQVQVQAGRDTGLDAVEELAERDGSMPGMPVAENPPAWQVKSGEQGRGAVAQVIVDAPFGLSGTHGQKRLRTVQSLDLRLFIHAQHQGLIRRIQIKPYHITHLLDEQRIAGKLKAFGPLRCKAKARQIRLTALWLSPQRRAMARVGPCVASRGALSRVSANTPLERRVADPPPRPRTRFVKQTVQAPLIKAAAPFAYRRLAHPHFAPHQGIGFALRAGQHHAGPPTQRLGRGSAPHPTRQGLAFLSAQPQGRNRPSQRHGYLPCDLDARGSNT